MDYCADLALRELNSLELRAVMSNMLEINVEGGVKTLELPQIVWSEVPHTFFIDAKFIHSGLEGYGTRCTKQALQKLCVDAIKRPLTREQEHRLIDMLFADITKYDADALINMSEDSKDYKVWKGDIIQFFFHKIMVGEALPMKTWVGRR
jgi:hypothetical protein